MFPSPLTNRPYYSTEIQKRLLKPIGIKLGLGPIGWHTFRHTYRSWLDETGAPMKGPAGAHASRVDSDDDERIRTGDAGVEKGSNREGRHHGTEASREGFSVT
jgi:hypothetical protein